MKRWSFPAWALIPVVVLLALAGVGIAYLASDEDEPEVQAVAIDDADANARPDDRLLLGPAAQEVRESAEEGEFNDLEGNLRGPDATPAGVIDGPLASQEWPGCETRFVKSFSSRRGITPNGLAYHYTAGFNLVGKADMDGLTAFSARRENQVSWHFLIDREGHCYYNVPVTQKAWTISGLNSQTINIEMIGRGGCATCTPFEPNYGGAAGIRTLARVTTRINRLFPSIKMQIGAVNRQTCRVTRGGVITHWMGGVCAGSHHDIQPYSLQAVFNQVKHFAVPTNPARLKTLQEWIGDRRNQGWNWTRIKATANWREYKRLGGK